MTNWIQGAIKRRGAFKAKAKKAGMNTMAFATKEATAPGTNPTTKKQAVLAKTLARFKKK